LSPIYRKNGYLKCRYDTNIGNFYINDIFDKSTHLEYGGLLSSWPSVRTSNKSVPLYRRTV